LLDYKAAQKIIERSLLQILRKLLALTFGKLVASNTFLTNSLRENFQKRKHQINWLIYSKTRNVAFLTSAANCVVENGRSTGNEWHWWCKPKE
jgi:hypothetical protein